jgi:cell division protein FtsB
MAEESRESWCDGDAFTLTVKENDAFMAYAEFAMMHENDVKRTAEEVASRIVHGAIQTVISPHVQQQVQSVFMFTMKEVGAQAEKVATLEAQNARLVAEMRALQEQTRILQEQNRQLADQMMHFMRQFEEARAR